MLGRQSAQTLRFGSEADLERVTVGALWAATTPPAIESGRSHRVDPIERLDGANEQCGGRSRRFGDDVEAVVHPVDKVHVGDPGRPEHDGIAAGLAEPGVARPVGFTEIRLELDDPAGAPGCVGLIADEQGSQKPARGLEGRQPDERRRVVQTATWNARTDEGTNSPKSA